MATTGINQGAAAGKRSRRPRILIVGLGNDLLTDDGVGVHVARMLKKQKLEPGVLALEVGTAILDALHLFERADYIVAIDGMQAGEKPGTIYQLSAEDVQLRERVSMHDFTFNSALTLLRRQPKHVLFFGIEPGMIDYGMGLTSEVQDAVEPVAQAVIGAVLEWTSERVAF